MMPRGLKITMLALLAACAWTAPLARAHHDADPTAARLADFASGKAEWVLDIANVGLPVGESHTLVGADGVLRSYLHASTPSAGVHDRNGRPVDFPGCVTVWESRDQGRSFLLHPTCLFNEHTEQQQYPRVARADDGTLIMVYEWRAMTMLRVSTDEGATWSAEQHVPGTGVSPGPCAPLAEIGKSPFYDQLLGAPEAGACLLGAPPGIFVDGDELYVFVDLGSNPAHLTCLRGPRRSGAEALRRCDTDALLSGAPTFGSGSGKAGNPFFDHRYLSSTDLVEEGGRYYLLFEGERGPSPPFFESQFGLGLAWSDALDSIWTRYPDNPLLMDLPGNIGVGHGDLVKIDGTWYLYTATSESTRGRYRLAWRPDFEPDRLASRLHGTILIDGRPQAGVTVTAWGHDGRDLHQASTDALGIYELPDLDRKSEYNVWVNAEFREGGPAILDDSIGFEQRENVRLVSGPDFWHGEDFLLSRRGR